MAFRTQKISQMTPKGSDLEATDLIEVSTIESGSYVTRSITGQELIDAIPAPTGFVPETRTLTINGTTQDLSADRTFTISTGITIGTTVIASGTVGRVLFQGTGNVVSQSANLFWDATNNRLGIGTSAPISKMQVITDNATSPFAFSSQTSQIAGTTTAGVFSAYSLTNGGYLNCGNPDVGWVNMTYLAGRHIFSLAGTEAMRITNGNVLINTTTDAGYRLDVNGTARVQGNVTLSTGILGFDGNTRFQSLNNNLFSHQRLSSSGTHGFDIRVSGGQSSFWTYNDGTGDVNFGQTAAGSGALKLFTANVERMRIFYTGNVGINTTTDAGFRLDVNGTARVSGNLTFAFGTTYITTSNTGGGINAGVNTFINNGATWVDDTSVRALDITYANGIKIVNTTRYPLSLGTSAKAVASAQIEMVSTTQGFLPPRMTTTQKNAIASPATGLMVYDTTLNVITYYNGTTWI